MQKIKARVRCGNKEDNNKYQESEVRKKCILCKEKTGTLSKNGTWLKNATNQIDVQNIISDEYTEEAIEWCRVLEKKRNEKLS